MLIISYLINFITKYLRKNIYNELNIRLKTFSYRDADMMRQKQRKAEEETTATCRKWEDPFNLKRGKRNKTAFINQDKLQFMIKDLVE